MDTVIMSTPRIGDLGDALTFFIAKCDGDFRACHLKAIYDDGEAICRTTRVRKKGKYKYTSVVRFKTLSHTDSTVYVVTVKTIVENESGIADWYPLSRGYAFVPLFNGI